MESPKSVKAISAKAVFPRQMSAPILRETEIIDCQSNGIEALILRDTHPQELDSQELDSQDSSTKTAPPKDSIPKDGSTEDAMNCTTPHPVSLHNVRKLYPNILSLDKAQRMAEFFSLLGDANRLRIVSALTQQELCVCDLAAIVKMSESAVSHQLRSLRAMRVVNYRKQGRKVFYFLKDSHVLNLYREVADHLDEPEE